MQITSPLVSSATASAPVPSIAPGVRLGGAQIIDVFGAPPAEVAVVAGPVLASGVRDITAAARQLIAQGRSGGAFYDGLVAFVRNGDAYDAVGLLHALPGSGSGEYEKPFLPEQLAGLRFDDGVQVDAIWQVSDHGFDTGFGTPSSRFPR